MNWWASNAKTWTRAGWVKSSVTGDHVCALWNSAFKSAFPFNYTINSANAWEYKSITVPGCTDGTWETGTNRGINIGFVQLSGSTYTGTPNQWNSSGDVAPTTHVNLLATSGATWYITGIQLEVGRNATDFEYRSYGEELALCQRYYWRVPNARWLMGYKRNDNNVFFQLDTPVPMRVSPTPTIHSVGLFTNHQTALGGSVLTSNCTVFEYRPDAGRGTLQVQSTYSGTHTIIPSWEAGTIDFDAEL